MRMESYTSRYDYVWECEIVTIKVEGAVFASRLGLLSMVASSEPVKPVDGNSLAQDCVHASNDSLALSYFPDAISRFGLLLTDIGPSISNTLRTRHPSRAGRYS